MKEEIFIEGLTFDDILIIPQYSEILPHDVDVQTKISERIKLNIPLISAAMDTVTESQTAIAIAREGGLGIIHKNMPADIQAMEVEKVKKWGSRMIYNPIKISPEEKIEAAINIMQRNNISGLPVVKDGVLVGILTNRDLRFESELSKKVSDVMTKKLITAKEGISFEESIEILHKNRIEKLPIVNDNGNLIALITVKDIEKKLKFPLASKDEKDRLFVGGAIGVGEEGVKRAGMLIDAGVDILCVDTAHGHSKGVIECVKKLKKNFKSCEIIAGNVATQEGCLSLIESGADCVKVGMGPGSICTTRVISGIGVPQVSAILNCKKIAKTRGKYLIADGGIRYSGDITKALALGGNAVMIGNIFAGTDEAPGEIVYYQGRSYKVYRGMGSIEAMKKGSKDRYFQEGIGEEKLVPEGIEGNVPYKGSISNVIHQLIGGLKGGMGYVGAKNIAELQEKSKFIRVSKETLKESHVHDVIITKEAPNYHLT